MIVNSLHFGTKTAASSPGISPVRSLYCSDLVGFKSIHKYPKFRVTACLKASITYLVLVGEICLAKIRMEEILRGGLLKIIRKCAFKFKVLFLPRGHTHF